VKLAASKRLSHERVKQGLNAVLFDPDFGIVQFTEPEILSKASKIREEITDFIDCLIFSSAAAKADIFLTEDQELQDLGLDEHMMSRLKPTNPEFRVYGSRRLA